MRILGFLKRRQEGGAKFPVLISTKFVPMRLNANKKDNVELRIKIKNLRDEKQLISLIVELPEGLSFDGTGLSLAREEKLGWIPPLGEKEIRLVIWGNRSTNPGEYKIRITVFGHHQNYNYVLFKIKKNVTLRAF